MQANKRASERFFYLSRTCTLAVGLVGVFLLSVWVIAVFALAILSFVSHWPVSGYFTVAVCALMLVAYLLDKLLARLWNRKPIDSVLSPPGSKFM